MTAKSIVEFVVQSIIATVGSIIGGYLVGFLIALPFGFASSGLGNIVDKTVDTWFFRHWVDCTFPILPVATAACLGFLSYRSSKPNSPAWVWLIPSEVLLWSVLPAVLHSADGRKWVYNNYFGSNCGSTECLYELLVTAPNSTHQQLTRSAGWLRDTFTAQQTWLDSNQTFRWRELRRFGRESLTFAPSAPSAADRLDRCSPREDGSSDYHQAARSRARSSR
jgi:hypothetical protein